MSSIKDLGSTTIVQTRQQRRYEERQAIKMDKLLNHVEIKSFTQHLVGRVTDVVELEVFSISGIRDLNEYLMEVDMISIPLTPIRIDMFRRAANKLARKVKRNDKNNNRNTYNLF